MSIKSPEELEKLKAIGRIVGLTLRAMAAHTRAGVTTGELDQVCARTLAEYGAEPSPPKVYKFPGASCISVNEEAIHGIPGDRVIRPGDLVKLDLVAEKDGYFADAAVSVNVPPGRENAGRLAHCAEGAFRRALAVTKPGHRIFDIGYAVEGEVRRQGFSVIRELCGHGVGRTIHEDPQIPNYPDARVRGRLTEGLVITIEPIISAGSGHARVAPDGWTVRTTDGCLAAHFEHTLVITRGEPLLLTAV
jgi:methionyl aminopeptidase